MLSLSIAARFLRKSPVFPGIVQQIDRILEISDGALLQDVRDACAAPRG